MSTTDREFDVVVWGATGFTGKLVAEYLMERYGIGRDLRWALGGRSQAKLEAVRAGLGAEASALPLVLGDSANEASMHALAARTRVVCTTVGPYAKYGSELVAACAQGGTHYCDLTGEPQWMRAMIDSHQKAAEDSGARIVHTCGFDSIPSDMGVFFLQDLMQSRHGVACSRVKYRVVKFKGGMSGGTIASMLNLMSEAASNPKIRRLIADPYALNPDGQRFGPDGGDQAGPAYDADFSQWTGPFVMAGINTRVVRRTNAILKHPYGANFQYDEATLMGRGPVGWAKAAALSASVAGGMLAGAVGPLRRAMTRFLPEPGDGPSKEERETGFFHVRLFGEHPEDRTKHLRASVKGDRDPGYGSTAKMLGESAVCLALDESNVSGGIWTPASAMGKALLGRLQTNAGLTFTLEEN